MAIIHDLINQIQDDELRARLGREVAGLLAQKKFGLVFEEHLPECTPLYGLPVSVGSKVARAGRVIDELWVVLRLEEAGGGVSAHCENLRTGQERCFARDELVVVAEFGEPVHPYLQPVEMLQSADQDAPPAWHTLIEADNYHALQLLTYLYTGKVDCIYIDPPYNTGARDWKYNNDYVDAGDQYRHSKWLSMMEKRLKIAKKLLNPTGTMIIAIDDYEFSHLVALIEELMPDYDISPVIVLHHPQGGAADNISRVHEYCVYITPKGMKVVKGNMSQNIDDTWSLMRGGTDIRNRRIGRPNSFYGIYVNKETLKVIGVGPRLRVDEPYNSHMPPKNCIVIYPIGKDGTERVWRYERTSMQEKIDNDEIICSPKFSLQVIKKREKKYDPIFSVWTDNRYNAGTHGTNLLYSIFGKENRFSYPKSLYTTKDAIKSIVQEKPDALILDFFAGSGTTLHAVNLLNSEDGGRRRCVLVTNNEVSEAEAKALRAQGLRPGDADWERLGIARHVTWPRTVCSLLGRDVNGQPLKGVYLDSEREMAQGFAAHAAFLKLGFLDKGAVAMGQAFFELLAVLWMKAGCVGRCPDGDALRRAHVARVGEAAADAPPAWLVLPENGFAVLADERAFTAFADEVNGLPEVQMVFLVTDSTANFYAMRAGVAAAQCRQLYRDYLDNFRINTGA